MAFKITEECIACGICQPDCDSNAISPNGKIYKIDGYLCTECGNCEEVCPVDAVESD